MRPVASASSLVDPALSSGFLAEAQSGIAAREYWASETDEGLQAPNRAHDLRSYFDARGVRVEDRNAPERTPLVDLSLTRIGREGSLASVPKGEVVDLGKGRVEIRRGSLGLVEWFENSSAGLEQGFTLSRRPELPSRRPSVGQPSMARSRTVVPSAPGDLVVELAVSGAKASLSGDRVRLVAAVGNPLDYGKLVVVDADGRTIAAHFEVPAADRIRIVVEDRKAAYPIVIDPLLTRSFDAVVESNLPSSEFGVSVASAGDVNGDGYDDVIVGADLYDQGESDEGAAFVFLGGPAGIGNGNPATADAVLEGNLPGASFGTSVASAGDVNGDGFADVVVGSYLFDSPQTNEGAAFVFHGSATGIASGGPAIAHGKMETDQIDARLGISVASAGDVNGDGFSDVVVGAFTYDAGQPDEGAAFVLLGSSTGIGNRNPTNAHATLKRGDPGAQLGQAVASAGDVNGDGYSDVIVGAPYYNLTQLDQGGAFLYLGSAAGIASPGSAHANFIGISSTRFGNSVSGAGDVNGDGYGDVIIGAPFHAAGQPNEGAAFVYHGSSLGFVGGMVDGSYFFPNQANRTLEGNQSESRFGASVATAGDVNGDGYGDVIVGAYGYDSGQNNEGVLFVYTGASNGIHPGRYQFLEYDQEDAFLGYSVASAGDVNGDGYGDVFAGAYLANGGQADEGAAFVYHGGASGFVNGGVQFAQSGASIGLASFGVRVTLVEPPVPAIRLASAGDVNGDGYGDAIIGIPRYDTAQVDSGAVFVVHGSSTGLKFAVDQFSVATRIFGVQSGEQFGLWVSSAGDVNGDGYGDVVVASLSHSNGEVDEGAAFVFLGSATGIASGTAANAHARLETNQDAAGVVHAGSAGDVNGDGFGDLVVSSNAYDAGSDDEGAAFVFHGSVSGIANGNPSTARARFETDQAAAGAQASSAGDLNGDGFGDVVVHSASFDSGEPNEGAAFVLLGSATGIASATPATAHAQFETNRADEGPSSESFSPGDVDGDGYSDLLFSAPLFSNGEVEEGSVFLFHGSAAGMVDGSPATADTRIETNLVNGRLRSIRFPGPADVNADGFADLLLYALLPSTTNLVFHGSAAGVPSSDLTAATSSFGGFFVAAGGDLNGDGHGDIMEADGALTIDPSGELIWGGFGVNSSLSNGGFGDALVRQRRGDGSGLVVSPGGSSYASQFVAELFARSPRGREYAKLEVEYCPGANGVFGAPTCLRQISPTWTDLGTSGSVLLRTIPGLVQGTPYVWRARARYAPYRPASPGVEVVGVAGPWYRIGASPRAVDIRIPAPEPSAVVMVAVGAAMLAGCGKRRRSVAIGLRRSWVGGTSARDGVGRSSPRGVVAPFAGGSCPSSTWACRSALPSLESKARAAADGLPDGPDRASENDGGREDNARSAGPLRLRVRRADGSPLGSVRGA